MPKAKRPPHARGGGPQDWKKATRPVFSVKSADAARLRLGFRLPLLLCDIAFPHRHIFIIGARARYDRFGHDRRAVRDDGRDDDARRVVAIAMGIAAMVICSGRPTGIIAALIMTAPARPPLLASGLVRRIADGAARQRADPGTDQRARSAVAASCYAVAGDAPHEPADNRAAHCAPPATAAFHFGVVTRVIPAAIIGIMGGRRRIAGAMAFDRAFIAALVTAAVGRFVSAVPGAGPPSFGVIAGDPPIFDFAGHT